jgi:hypothetical protein
MFTGDVGKLHKIMPQVFDFIGVPFPTEHEKFKDDKKIQSFITQIESYQEIIGDLEEARLSLKALEKLKLIYEESATSFGFQEVSAAMEATASHACVLYSRCFNSNTAGRSILNRRDVFKDESTLECSAHDFFVDLPDQHFAHASSNLNDHKLYMLESNNSAGFSLVLNGRTRQLMSRSYRWENLIKAIEHCLKHVKLVIEVKEVSLKTQLTAEQKLLIKATKWNRYGAEET